MDTVNGLQSTSYVRVAATSHSGKGTGKSGGVKPGPAKGDPVADSSNKPDLKEIAMEMLKKPQKLGAFKDKKGLEQTTDLTMGADIRCALTSRNVEFLKRLSWGGLTVSEYREIKYRIRELENCNAESCNIVDPKDALKKMFAENTDGGEKIDLKI